MDYLPVLKYFHRPIGSSTKWIHVDYNIYAKAESKMRKKIKWMKKEFSELHIKIDWKEQNGLAEH